MKTDESLQGKMKRRISITAKFLFGTVLVLLLNLVCVFAVTSFQIGTTTESLYQRELEKISESSVELFLDIPIVNPNIDIKAIIMKFESTYPYKLAIIENDKLYYNGFIDDSQIESLRKNGSGWINIGQKRYFYSIQDIKVASKTGTLKTFIAKEIPLISEQMQNVLLFSGIAILLISIPTILLLFVLFRRMSRQIVNISAVASQIADGNLGERVDIRSKDEIGDLAVSINNMTEKLQRDEADRDAFLAGVSHELRTPLTTLKANTKGIIDGIIPLDKTMKYLLSNIEEIDRLTMMVNDLIQVSSFEQSNALVIEDTNLGDLVMDVIRRMEISAMTKNILFTHHIEENLILSIDKLKLTQVFVNVIDNAIHYSQDNSEVQVSAKRAEGRILITVQDKGGGIEFDNPDKIFERFIKGRHSSGLGLGMYISKLIVTAHGGSIQAINANDGTLIKIVF